MSDQGYPPTNHSTGQCSECGHGSATSNHYLCRNHNSSANVEDTRPNPRLDSDGVAPQGLGRRETHQHCTMPDGASEQHQGSSQRPHGRFLPPHPAHGFTAPVLHRGHMDQQTSRHRAHSASNVGLEKPLPGIFGNVAPQRTAGTHQGRYFTMQHSMDSMNAMSEALPSTPPTSTDSRPNAFHSSAHHYRLHPRPNLFESPPISLLAQHGNNASSPSARDLGQNVGHNRSPNASQREASPSHNRQWSNLQMASTSGDTFGRQGYRMTADNKPQFSAEPSPSIYPADFVDVATSVSAASEQDAQRPKKVKQHQCNICQKRFPRPSGLATHMNSHSGERPFKCPVQDCDKSFTVRSNAKRHSRIHGLAPEPEPSIPTAPINIGFHEPQVSNVQASGHVPQKLRWIAQDSMTPQTSSVSNSDADDADDADDVDDDDDDDDDVGGPSNTNARRH